MRLVACGQCKTQNTLDSLFCRHCGAELPAEELEAMKSQTEKVLIDGRQLLSDGRTSEAAVLAESVLAVDPQCADALSLLGDAYEKDGDYSAALEAYQKVLEIRPDSPVDRIKVSQLEKLAAQEEIEVEPAGNPRRGLLLVAAATVLLASVGASFYLASLPQSVDTSRLVAENDQASGFRQFDPTLVPTTPQSSGASSADLSGVATGQTNDPIVGRDPTRFGIGGNSSGNGGFVRAADPQNPQVAPFDPVTRLTPVDSNGSASKKDTVTDNAELAANSGRQAEPKPEDPGVVEIRVKEGQANSNPGAETVDVSADEWIRRARNLSLQEDFSGAAAAYEKAISLGMGTGATYQRLAQCYEKLGRRSDALKNYRHAVRAYDQQIARGAENLRASKESCERAIEALGG
jgi:tetratricopeptide (TPR) repeat protein